VPAPTGAERVRAANEARMYNSARRAIDDPVVLGRAARIVRVALARKALTLADLEPMPDPASDSASALGASS